MNVISKTAEFGSESPRDDHERLDCHTVCCPLAREDTEERRLMSSVMITLGLSDDDLRTVASEATVLRENVISRALATNTS